MRKEEASSCEFAWRRRKTDRFIQIIVKLQSRESWPASTLFSLSLQFIPTWPAVDLARPVCQLFNFVYVFAWYAINEGGLAVKAHPHLSHLTHCCRSNRWLLNLFLLSHLTGQKQELEKLHAIKLQSIWSSSYSPSLPLLYLQWSYIFKLYLWKQNLLLYMFK